MWTSPYDPLTEIAGVDHHLTRQDTTHGLLPLSRGHSLHLCVETADWLRTTLPLPSWLATLQTEERLGHLLQAQNLLAGDVKFGMSPSGRALGLYGDLPLHPRTLLLPRWQVLRQGFVQGLRFLKRLRGGTTAGQSETQGSQAPAPATELAENVRAVLQEGEWSWTEQQGVALVTVPLKAQVQIVRLVQMEANGRVHCRLEHPLPTALPTVCRRAVGTFVLEGNSRLRLVRLGHMAAAHNGVVAEVSLEPDWVDVMALGQALDAVAVAAHLIWPVLPALATEEVARHYLQTRGSVPRVAGIP
jgi:hypothetical protein